MGRLQELLEDFVKTGPTNVKRLLELAERLPSDDTLRRLSSNLASLIPYIPQLERILNSDGTVGLKEIAAKIPDEATLKQLALALPALEHLPSEEVLKELLEKFGSLQGLIDALDKD